MIALLLQDALVEKLQALFSEYQLPCKGLGEKEVRIFSQYLPQPRSVRVTPNGVPVDPSEGEYGPEDYDANFPCVIVKVEDGIDHEEGAADATRIALRILVGCYDSSADCQGYRDVMNIIETIRQNLLSQRVLDNRYRLEMPQRWCLFDDQPWPVFFGQIETVWETGRPLARGR